VTFKHLPLTPIDLPSLMDGDKRYYVLPDGTRLKSVTTILGERLDKSGLDSWRERVGVDAADRIRDVAGRHGTRVHSALESHLMNREVDARGMMPTTLASFRSIAANLDEHLSVVCGLELPLYSLTLMTAGRTDLVGVYDGVPSIVDFKTSLKPKRPEWIEGYFLQTTAYSMMVEEMYGVILPKIVVCVAVETENDAQVFVRDRNEFIPRVIEVFR
jgi:hypothetical protein